MTVDVTLQAQVDAQLIEQGAFTAIELLMESGRLIYSDYESWRRGEIEFLDGVLMGSKEKIRAQVEQAVSYARHIGLVEETQEFLGWASSKALRISADAPFHRLIAGRYAPPQTAPQMDLFFDNPVVALTNGIVRALSARNVGDAHRQLDRLYAHAPNHADLAAFDRLVTALGHLGQPIDNAQQELDFLLEVTPAAKRLLASQSRDLLSPLWRQLAEALGGQPFAPDRPNLHRSFVLIQAQDWPGAGDAVLASAEWWRHAALCLRLAQSAFHQRRRVEALTAWCHLFWLHPAQASEVLDKRRQPDAELATWWQRFLDCEEEFAPSAVPSKGTAGAGAHTPHGNAPLESALMPADFPTWMLLTEPSLAQRLPVDLPIGTTPSEQLYRCVHRLLTARRANQREAEMAERKALQTARPALFRYLKQTVAEGAPRR